MTQTVPDISPLMPMHQDPLLVHYSDAIMMSAMSTQITSLTIVYSTIHSGVDQRKHQSSASSAFVRGMVNSPHKGPVTRKMFPFFDVIMTNPSKCTSATHGFINLHRDRNFTNTTSHAKVNYHLPRKRTLVAQLIQLTHGLKQTDRFWFLSAVRDFSPVLAGMSLTFVVLYL